MPLIYDLLKTISQSDVILGALRLRITVSQGVVSYRKTGCVAEKNLVLEEHGASCINLYTAVGWVLLLFLSQQSVFTGAALHERTPTLTRIFTAACFLSVECRALGGSRLRRSEVDFIIFHVTSLPLASSVSVSKQTFLKR